jgi:hypothetical protein
MQVGPFDFEGLEVRVITDGRANPWFVAADVCGAMDLGNTSQALTRLDEDEKGVITNEGLQTQGFGPQSLNVINESGLYSLILTSRQEEAKRFKRWVTREVLPSIRKTGNYSLTGAAPERGSAWQVYFRKGDAPTPSRGLESKLPDNDPGSGGSAQWDRGGQRQETRPAQVTLRSRALSY